MANSKANRIETMKGRAESGEICSVEVEKIAKKIAKNKRCYANTLRPAQEIRHELQQAAGQAGHERIRSIRTKTRRSS
jgi:hypothetical protein